MEKFNVKDIEGALILVSCNTVELNNKRAKYQRVLPYTIREGEFRGFELDDNTEDIDNLFPMEKYDEYAIWDIDLDEFDTVNEVAQHILRTDGKKIINTLYNDGEVVADNKLTISIFDSSREEVYSASKTFKISHPEPSKGKGKNEKTEGDIEVLFRPLDMTDKDDEIIFLHDRRIVLFHLEVVAVVTILVWILGFVADWNTKGCWLISIASGLYFTQLWWCNMPRKSLGSRLWNDKVRHAKGRPWINGGAISGLALTVIMASVFSLCGKSIRFADYYLIFFIITLCITFAIWALKKSSVSDKAKSPSEYAESLLSSNSNKQLKRLRRDFWKEFFRRLLPWNW